MTHQEDALQEIISIAKRNNLTASDISRALTGADAAARTSSGAISKLFNYIGAIFVLGGLCAMISMFWGDIGSAGRVIVTLGTGTVLFILGVASLYDPKHERMVTPLFVASSLLQPGGIFVLLDEYAQGGDWRYGMLFMTTIMLIQNGAVFWTKRRTVLLFTLMFFGSCFIATLFDLIGISHNLNGVVLGTSLLCITYAINQTKHAAICSFWYVVSSITLMLSFFDAVERTFFEVLYLGLTAFIIFLSTHVRNRSLLLVGVLGMFWYIGYFTMEYFANTLGWPIALIICGAVFMGLGSVAMKINNKYIKS